MKKMKTTTYDDDLEWLCQNINVVANQSGDYSEPWLCETDKIIDLLDLHTKTQEVLMGLSPRQEAIIRLRYGIGDVVLPWLKKTQERGNDLTCSDIGVMFGVTRGRVGAIQKSALRALRDPKLAKKLRSFVDW